jgi:hypothetical protein
MDGRRVVLRTCPEFEAELYADRLRAAGIDAEVSSRGPRYGAGWADLLVAELDAEPAEDVLCNDSDALPVPNSWAAPKRRPWWARRRIRP